MSHRLVKQPSCRLLFNSFTQSFENVSNKSATKKRYGSTVPYKPQKILQRFYRLFDTPALFKRRFNGRTVLKYGAPRIVFGTFRRYGNAVELPCYGSKTGTLFCPLLYACVLTFSWSDQKLQLHLLAQWCFFCLAKCHYSVAMKLSKPGKWHMHLG